MQLFLFLFCCRKSGIDSKSLRAFFTPLGQLKVCPNLLGRRLVIQKALKVFHPCGAACRLSKSSWKTISDSKSLRAFFTPSGQPEVCPNLLGRRLVIQKALGLFSPLWGSLKSVQIFLEED